MDEVFKNDKMYTSWDDVESKWCFYHTDGVAVHAFESLEKIKIRHHTISDNLTSRLVQKNPKFGLFFQYPPIRLSEKASHGFSSVGKAIKSPEVFVPGIAAIITGVMTFLILNSSTTNPSTNTTLANATNPAEMVASIKLNYTAVTLAMLVAMTIFNVAVAAYKKYNEPVPDSKLFMKKIEKELEEKEKIVSSFIHFMRRKFEAFPISENDVNFIIFVFEASCTPSSYIQIKKSIELLSSYEKKEHLRIVNIILVKYLAAINVDLRLGQNYILDDRSINDQATKDKFALILRILENPTLISYVEKINSIFNPQRTEEEIEDLYKKLDTLSKEHTFIFELIKSTPVSTPIGAENIPRDLFSRLRNDNPNVVLNAISDFKESLERQPGQRHFLNQ